MSMFQKSVEKKYLNELDSSFIEKKYTEFQNYFGNPERQENIRNAKEEQFQEGFLRELFVNILGYTLNPELNFNLTTELKNISNSKKADGAILKNENAHAVIELKSTNTTDLDSIETQAFGYKNHHPKCVYVITSNFEKLRFYIQNAVDHIDFDLFNLSKEQFSLMWLCLAKDNLLTDLPLKIKDSSILQEENITKKLYADYSKFRTAIFNNLINNNPDTDKLLLFKKTQKLLDRFLFIFFAEDRLLLPPNSISEIVKQWKTLKDELDEYVPLYARFKKYFGYMNTGFKGKKYDIYAYNGGLFKPDEILDNILIDDEILHEHTVKLSNYDFETDVDVNILGHIFEHSLGEIAAIAATRGLIPLTDTRVITKRKKDGIFYTPKYITKYIVENTVGKLCNEKRNELQIIDEEYAKGRKNRKKEIVRTLDKKLDEYRNWLLTLTILDPACGSGAFLNQALEFLINEHKKVDELRTQLFGGAIIFSDITTDILEKNIFGVDLNEESVEIAKLSLWLRTAQKGRKLNTLSNNIKCGNSLIDDPEIAGQKAFDWNKEFPHIFRKKGKKTWHITTAIHNSRYSQRMFDYHITTDDASWLSENDEIVITEIIAGIIKEDKLNVVEYNICGDHMHLLLVCEKDELTRIVGKIKGKSARLYHSNKGINPLVRIDGEKSVSLWTQKFGKSEIKDEDYLDNAIEYIRNNRIKHELPKSEKIEKIKENFLCTKEYAFRTEYTGGFDVVIGNPPYVRQELLGDYKPFFEKEYSVYEGASDLFAYFYEKSFKIIKSNGMFGFISNTFDKTKASVKLRKFLTENTDFTKYIDFTEVQIFEGATTYPIILIAKNSTPNKHNFEYIKIPKSSQSAVIDIDTKQSVLVVQDSLDNDSWNFNSIDKSKLLSKITQNKTIREQYGKCYRGVVTGFNDAFIIDKTTKVKLEQQHESSKELIKPFYEGKDILKWNSPLIEKYIIFTRRGTIIDNFPAIKLYLEQFKERLTPKNSPDVKIGRKKGSYKWFEIQDSVDYYKLFEEPKITWANLQSGNKFSFEQEAYYINAPSVILPSNNKALLCIVNSKLVWEFLKSICVVRSGGYIEVKPQYFEQIPIPEINNQDALNTKTDNIIAFISKSQKVEKNFTKYIQSQFNIEKLSKKLQNWHELDFADFIKELNKAIKKVGEEKLTKTDEMDWMYVFETKKAEAQTLKAEIDKTDKEIDAMVYALYGLTEEEIKIVENSSD